MALSDESTSSLRSASKRICKDLKIIEQRHAVAETMKTKDYL